VRLVLIIGLVLFLRNTFYYISAVRVWSECDFSIPGRLLNGWKFLKMNVEFAVHVQEHFQDIQLLVSVLSQICKWHIHTGWFRHITCSLPNTTGRGGGHNRMHRRFNSHSSHTSAVIPTACQNQRYADCIQSQGAMSAALYNIFEWRQPG